jgi:hypothetical protein
LLGEIFVFYVSLFKIQAAKERSHGRQLVVKTAKRISPVGA